MDGGIIQQPAVAGGEQKSGFFFQRRWMEGGGGRLTYVDDPLPLTVRDARLVRYGRGGGAGNR